MKQSQSSPATSSRGMNIGPKCLLWAIISLVTGAIGGEIGDRFFDAPFYFGFFFTFVLVGLTGMFVIAVHVANQMEKIHQERREKLMGPRP